MLVCMSMYTTAVWVGMIETFVCASITYVYSISHDSACLGRQEDVVILHWNINSFAAVQVQFAQQNYTVIEGNVVDITLVTNTSDYEFNFTVTLQYTDGTATGESFNWNRPLQEHLRAFSLSS